MPPDLSRHLLNSFEIAAFPANFNREAVMISAAANGQMATESETIFRTIRK